MAGPLKENPIEDPQTVSKKLPFKNIYYRLIKRGGLISCQYKFWHHDPYPLILVTDVFPDRIRGINLHYLTYNYIYNLLNNYCEKGNFSYANVRGDSFMLNAFRTYKKDGLRMIKQLDCETIKNALNITKSVKTEDMNAIRKELRQQIQKQINPTAEDLMNQQNDILNITKPKSATIPTIPTKPASIPTEGV